MLELYSPKNEVELALLKSILDAEEINYFVRNDNFGSLEIGPKIELFNKKMIIVQDDQYEKAKELLADYLSTTENEVEQPEKKYSMSDFIRMGIEFLIKGIIIGLSVSIPLGPIGVMCIQRTLSKGRLSGFVSGMGAASADIIYSIFEVGNKFFIAAQDLLPKLQKK